MAHANKEANKAYMREYMKERYLNRRSLAIESLGSKCVKCGSTEELEFDHIDPETKEFTIGNGSSFSDSRWHAEIAKCQLLCRTCHTEKHKSESPCGTPQRYWCGCRCIECKAANAKHNKEYKERLRSTK